MNKSTTSKQVTFLTRYELKSSKSIIYHIENGGGKRYYVTLHPNGDTACTCKHGENAGLHAHCYHVKECQAREAARAAEHLEDLAKQQTQRRHELETSQKGSLNGRNFHVENGVPMR